MILLISTSKDKHILDIQKILQQKKAAHVIFITDEYSGHNYIGFKNGKIFVIAEDKKIRLEEVSAVLARHPYYWEFTKEQTADDEIYLANELRREEVNNLVKAFITECRRHNIFVINNFDNPIEFKLSNYLRAKEIGFTVPETIIGNRQEDFTELQNDDREYVIKPFVSRTDFRNKMIVKQLKAIKGTELYHKLATVNPTYPVQLQEIIRKQFDLRITIAGKQVYACAIYSQENPATRLDMGATMFEGIRHEAYELPEDIKKLCLELCRKNSLNHGAIDMALDTKGRYVYFEINPYGEYLWIEEETGLKISEGMANLLMFPEKYKLV